MIEFGIRQSFDKVKQIEERFSNLNVPVELALPYYWDIYEPIRVHLKTIAENINSFHTNVLSIHAVQAPITDERFKIWGKEIADFSRTLGVKIITVHPNNTNKTHEIQKKALENLEYFNALYKNEITFCIETFLGSRRVFVPDEIVKFNLPMTLDTAHIKDDKDIWRLLKKHKENIPNIHLSAKGDKVHHLPIDNFCREVVVYLKENQWNGNVILEYLPEFGHQLLIDLESLISESVA